MCVGAHWWGLSSINLIGEDPACIEDGWPLSSVCWYTKAMISTSWDRLGGSSGMTQNCFCGAQSTYLHTGHVHILSCIFMYTEPAPMRTFPGRASKERVKVLGWVTGKASRVEDLGGLLDPSIPRVCGGDCPSLSHCLVFVDLGEA